jgi:rhodanese-related sulfurtransferase
MPPMAESMSLLPSALDDRVPPIGAVSPHERTLRLNWLAAVERSPGGAPLIWPELVARQGRSVRIVDVREADELIGPLGHIPGIDWIPRDRVTSLAQRLDRDAKIVLVSRAGERSGPLAKELEQLGMRFVASMVGGMVSWRYLGYHTTRDPGVLGRRDVLREIVPPGPGERPLSIGAVEAHVGDPQSIRWMKLAGLLLHGRQSCVDGRDEMGVIGTPGGDSGELLLALAALEQVTGQRLSPVQIAALFTRRIEALGRFYLHGDVHASNALIASMRQDHRLDTAILNVHESAEWRRFFGSPPSHVRDIVLEHILRAEHLGCGHLRLAMQSPDVYGARSELVKEVVRSFFRARWSGATEPEFEVLPGGHEEGAVVNVRIDAELRSFTPIPLVSPTANGTQMFVNHPQVSAHHREELAHFLAMQDDVASVSHAHVEPLAQVMNEIADRQLAATLGRLAKGLPVYDVVFGARGSFHVTPRGQVS